MHPAVATPRLISVEDARRIVLEQAAPRGVERVALTTSLGRVLAKNLVAEVDLPPFDNSAMDGYALRSSDATEATDDHPVQLRLVGEVAAGRVLDRMLGHGEAVKIMTGAPLPPGADSVVMLEQARLRGGVVELRTPVAPGSHIRNAGEDIKAGEMVLKAGTRVRLQHLGLLAGLGYATLPVSRVPTVAVLATGSELVNIDEPLAPGKIRNSNSLMLTTLLRRRGIQPNDLGTVIDDRALIQRALEEAAVSDVILISGGVSVGDHDFVTRILRDLGMETLFWRVNMKPGKPLVFGRWRGKMVFGLPGNPISCVVCFLEFIAPFLQKVTGEQDPRTNRIHARLTQPISKQEPRLQLLTARLDETQGILQVAPIPQQGSGMLNSLAQANALIVMPEDTMQLEAGLVVDVIPFGGDPWLW